MFPATCHYALSVADVLILDGFILGDLTLVFRGLPTCWRGRHAPRIITSLEYIAPLPLSSLHFRQSRELAYHYL